MIWYERLIELESSKNYERRIGAENGHGPKEMHVHEVRNAQPASFHPAELVSRFKNSFYKRELIYSISRPWRFSAILMLS